MSNITYRAVKVGPKRSKGRWGIEVTEDGKASIVVTGLKAGQAKRRVSGLVYGNMDINGVATKNSKAEAEAEAEPKPKKQRRRKSNNKKPKDETNG